MRKAKLSKRAKTVLECLECQIEVCAGYEKGREHLRLPFKTVASSVLSLMAGLLALDPTLHDELAEASLVAPRKTILALQETAKRKRK